jgi:hypothetical protein
MDAIADRAVGMYRSLGVRMKRLDILMDVHATHSVCPLRLDDLLAADDFNFSHDIGGIARHLNRQTGEMEDFFVPRFAAPQGAYR